MGTSNAALVRSKFEEDNSRTIPSESLDIVNWKEKESDERRWNDCPLHNGARNKLDFLSHNRKFCKEKKEREHTQNFEDEYVNVYLN